MHTKILMADANTLFWDVLLKNTPRKWVLRESKVCLHRMGVPYMWASIEDVSTEQAQELVELCGLDLEVVALDAADAFSLGFSGGEGKGTYVLPLVTATLLSLNKISGAVAKAVEDAQR